MPPWGRISEAEYRRAAVLAPSILEGIPVHDAWRVLLPGTSRACSMLEVRKVAAQTIRSQSRFGLVQLLFGVRKGVGRLLGWDAPVPRADVSEVARRVPDEARRASLVTPGKKDGAFEVVYVHEREAVSEVRNATVEAWLVWVLRPAAEGCDLLWAIHVRPTGCLTRPYLTLIAPFRRFVVYPTLLRRLHSAWSES